MTKIIAVCLALFAFSCSVAAEEIADVFRRPGPFAIEALDLVWRDAARNRDVPARVYLPEGAEEPRPVIIFSHGAGGSRMGYEFLGRRWASHGYVSVHLQHRGSDIDAMRGAARPIEALREAVGRPENIINRPLDVTFALDRLTELNREEGRFQGRLDMDKIGVAGHSFGAYTTMAVAGQVYFTPLGRDVSLTEPRVKAAIPMSTPAPRNGDRLERAFAGIKIPCLHMTGTLDDSLLTETKAADRRVPFDHTPANADQYLIIFIGGDHMIFSGRIGRRPQEKDELFQELIMASSTAFWKAYLLSDADALDWMRGEGLDETMRNEATVERKLAD